MRKVSLLFAGTFLLLGLSKTSYGQASATANVSATIIAPIAITKTNDMNFGRAAATAAAGTVVLTPAGTRSFTGGVTLPSFGGTGDVSPAIFTVSGAPTYTYSHYCYNHRKWVKYDDCRHLDQRPDSYRHPRQ